MIPLFVITTGEPAGIGPDIIIRLAQIKPLGKFCVIADIDLLRQRAKEMNLPLTIRENQAAKYPGELNVLHQSLAAKVQAGIVDPCNTDYVLRVLDQAIDGCVAGEFSGMITGPVHKGVINDAGIRFSGHTEYIADRCGSKSPVMMLANSALRVCLATTHHPLADVPALITRDRLLASLRIVDHDMRRWFACQSPNIAVCGLNPHAGEGGYLGREEVDTIVPVLRILQNEGLRIQGPYPADTVFDRHHGNDYDVIFAMYHDQGLPVLKYAGFGESVNVTLGLPIIRTSVDHGTALELAGRGHAEPGSLMAALNQAVSMSLRSRGQE